MNLKKRRRMVRFFVGCVPLFLVASGCNNAPQYKYQSSTSVSAGESNVSSVTHAQGAAGSESGTDVSESASAAPEVSAPATPVVSVGELLQNSHSYDKRKINVTGRKGALLSQYNMAYLINASDKSYLAFYYENMSSDDRMTLSRLGDLKNMTVSGVWDASKKILNGEELVQPAM